MEKIMNTETEELKSWISKCTHADKKAVYIKKTTEMILEKYNGMVPGTLEEITALPGVGLKMAHILL